MEMKEKLDIVNFGGSIEETGDNSWLGKKIRKGKKIGKVIKDMNGRYRILTVKFNDNSIEEIILDNLYADDVSVREYKFLADKTWYNF